MKRLPLAATLCAALVVTTSCGYFDPGRYELISYKDYSSDYPGDRLILNGYVSSGHGVFAEVRHSVRPESPGASDSVPDATVVLLRDGQPVATLRRNDRRRHSADFQTRYGFYLLPSDFRIEAGRSYALRATSPTYGEAESAPDVVPPAVGIDSVWADTYYDGRWRGYHVAYAVRGGVRRVYPVQIGYRCGLAHASLFFFYDEVAAPPFSGPSVISVDRFYYPRLLDSVAVQVLSLSDRTADFLQSVAGYVESDDDEGYEYPLDVRQNVSGGYGFVGAYSVAGLTLVADSANSVPGVFYDEAADCDDRLDPRHDVLWTRFR